MIESILKLLELPYFCKTSVFQNYLIRDIDISFL
jgi:hypothetical protein